MKEPKYVAATLKWCNERRKEKGMRPLRKLPKGKRLDKRSCPCGKSTGLNVATTWWDSPPDHRDYGNLPPAVSDFVIDFDAGKLPQYDISLSSKRRGARI